MSDFYANKGESSRLRFKAFKNKLYLQLDFYTYAAYLSLFFTICVLIFVEIVYPNTVCVDDLLSNTFNALINFNGSFGLEIINNNGEVYIKEQLSKEYLRFVSIDNTYIFDAFLDYFIYLSIVFAALFIPSSGLIYKFTDKYTKEMHNTKIIRGSRILINEMYLKIIKKHKEEDSICLTPIYKVEKVKQKGEKK